MDTTRSRTGIKGRLGGRTLALFGLGLLAGIAFYVLFAAVLNAPKETRALAPSNSFVVNTTSDAHDASVIDPLCEVAPIGSGKCSLRAAIEQIDWSGKKLCNPCGITFDPAVFPRNPGGPVGSNTTTIPINSLGYGPLPEILWPTTIDNTGTTVILEPFVDQAGTHYVDYGLEVVDVSEANPTDFTLIGDGHFTLRGFTERGVYDYSPNTYGDGILICGDSAQNTPYLLFSPATGPKGGVDYNNFAGQIQLRPGSTRCDGDSPVENVSISGVIINGVTDNGIEILSTKATNISITNSQIDALSDEFTGDAININDSCSTCYPTDAVISGNTLSADTTAIDFGADKCVMDITHNLKITGGERGIDGYCGDGSIIHIDDNGPIQGNENQCIELDVGTHATITIDRNGDITGGGADYVCIELYANTGSTVEIKGNGHIEGGEDAIQIDALSGGSLTGLTATIDGNNGIKGWYGDAVEIDDSSANSVHATITNNHELYSGGDEDGIYFDVNDGGVLTVHGNGDIRGVEYAMEIYAHDALVVSVTNNGNLISGENEAVHIDINDGGSATFDSNGMIQGGVDGFDITCNDNNTFDITNNGDIVGWNDTAIEVDSCNDSTSLNVSNNGHRAVAGAAATYYGNGDIIGGSYGIYFSVSNNSTLIVHNNGNVIGFNTDAVYASVGTNHTGEFSMNGNFRGGSDGIYYSSAGSHLRLLIADNHNIQGFDSYAIYVGGSDDEQVRILRNGVIEGGDYAVYVDGYTSTLLDIENNGDITGFDSEAIYIDSYNHTTVTVLHNGNIEGYEDGVEVDNSSYNDQTVTIKGNGDINSHDDAAISVDGANSVTVNINHNGTLRGGNEETIDITGDDDLNVSVVSNGDILNKYNDDAIDIDGSAHMAVLIDGNGNIITYADDYYALSIDGTDASSVTVTNNGDLVGSDGNDVDLGNGSTIDISHNGNIKAGADYPALDLHDGDNSTVTVDSNGNIYGGYSNAAVQIDPYSTFSNSSTINVINNGDITGGAEGVDINDHTTVTFHIDGNGDIKGLHDDGINVENDIIGGTIKNNGVITGYNYGIHLEGDCASHSCPGSSADARINRVTIDNNTIGVKGVGKGSGEAGIELDCRKHDNRCVGSGNVIKNNSIAANSLDGVVLLGDDGVSFRENTIGPNNAIFRNGGPGVCILDSDNNDVIQNQIYENGQNSDECFATAPIQAAGAAGNSIAGAGGVVIEAECRFEACRGTGSQAGAAGQGGAAGTVPTPTATPTLGSPPVCPGNPSCFEAKGNTISQNSMWSNFGLGIDLGSDGLGCRGAVSGGAFATPKPPIRNDLANNCNQTPNHTPFGPPAPQLVAGGKVGGRINTPDADALCGFCTVEVFVTDNPPDPTNHGEGFYFLGAVQTDGTGIYSLPAGSQRCGAPAGSLTITVTDRNGNTSEFSPNTSGFNGTGPCAPAATPTPTRTNTPVPTTPAPTNTPTHTAVPTTPAATSTPTNTPTRTNTPMPTTAAKACGDVNDDGSVDSRDALLVLQFKAALITSLPNEASADVNNDGQITSVDAALILQKEAGLIAQSGLHCS